MLLLKILLSWALAGVIPLKNLIPHLRQQFFTFKMGKSLRLKCTVLVYFQFCLSWRAPAVALVDSSSGLLVQRWNEMTKIIRSSSPGLFPSASSSSAPIEGAQKGHVLLRISCPDSSVHASTSLPEHPKEEKILKDSKKDKPRSEMSLCSDALRNAAHVALLRNTTSQYRLLLPLSTDKDIPGTSLANTFS